MSGLTETLTLRVSPELRAELERLAEAEQRKPSDLHRLLLEDALIARRPRSRGSRRV